MPLQNGRILGSQWDGDASYESLAAWQVRRNCEPPNPEPRTPNPEPNLKVNTNREVSTEKCER
jgi:hypothetical protein